MKATCLVILALSLLCSAAVPSQAAGKLVVDNRTHNFGKVFYGDKVSHTFVVKNVGKEPLHIKKVDVDCGCTKAVKGDSEIAPDGKTEIVVEFDTEGERSGKIEKSVYIHSSDTTAPDYGVKLTLLAEIVRELEVDPPTFAKTLPKLEETVSVPIKIINASDVSRTIKSVTSTEPNILAKLEADNSVLPPRTTVPLNVMLHLKRNHTEPFYKGKILLETDHPPGNASRPGAPSILAAKRNRGYGQLPGEGR
jgi:hypothetical protein